MGRVSPERTSILPDRSPKMESSTKPQPEIAHALHSFLSLFCFPPPPLSLPLSFLLPFKTRFAASSDPFTSPLSLPYSATPCAPAPSSWKIVFPAPLRNPSTCSPNPRRSSPIHPSYGTSLAAPTLRVGLLQGCPTVRVNTIQDRDSVSLRWGWMSVDGIGEDRGVVRDEVMRPAEMR